MNIIDQIISSYSNNKSLYIGEGLTISEHMIQTAMLAEKNKSSSDLICSSLLHDYGHFIIHDPNQLVNDQIDGIYQSLNDYGSNIMEKDLKKIIYDRYDYLNERRNALQKISTRLKKLINI